MTLALQSRYSFPKDSSLKILTSGLLGEQYIGIEAGADEKNLQAGDTISATQSAVVLENLISQFLYSKAAEGSSGRVQQQEMKPISIRPAATARHRTSCPAHGRLPSPPPAWPGAPAARKPIRPIRSSPSTAA